MAAVRAVRRAVAARVMAEAEVVMAEEVVATAAWAEVVHRAPHLPQRRGFFHRDR